MFISQKCVSCAAFFLLDVSGGKTLAATSASVPGSGPGSVPVGDIV